VRAALPLIRRKILMGRAVRERPARLAEKLLHIRRSLGLSQNGLIRHIGMADELVQADISTYELDQREPPLKILLAYARAANVSVEALIDDEVYLPENLPAHPKSEGIRRIAATKHMHKSRR
jgi:transcriptional regulator with XRE-family HTH domain